MTSLVTSRHGRRGPGSPRMMTLAALVLLAGCTAPDAPSGPAGDGSAGPSAGVTGAACGMRVETGPLPEWADAGFSGDARAPHVIGVRGEIAAVLFGHPLTHPRGESPTNKILWVSRQPVSTGDTLIIEATLDGTAQPVTREVAGGPGPSIVDLPQAGCWRLRLSWSGRTDTLDLTYAPG
jgi:hypothetical protein